MSKPREYWLDTNEDHYYDDTEENLIAGGFIKVIELTPLVSAAPEMLASIEHAARYLRESLLPETIRENVEPEAQMLADFESVIAKATGNTRTNNSEASE